MSRILMISTNRELSPQPAIPIGAAWVAEALRLAGFQVRLLDLCFQKEPLRAVAKAIEDFRPDGIGISVRNLDNCDFLSPKSFLPELKEITDFVKSHTEARILLGGAGVSIMPREVLQYLGLEWAVVGEGERAAVEFFSNRGGGLAPDGASPLVRSTGTGAGAGYCAPPPCPSPSGGGDAEPFTVMPLTHRWVDTARYLRQEPVLPVQGKRGCANRCLYCTYGRIEGSTWRLREPAAVVDEIATAMRETGATEFEFVDSVFNEPEGYLEPLLEEVLLRRLKARFRASSLTPKGLTREQLKLMERAGFASLVITPESASDTTLAALGKEFTEDQVHNAAALLASSGIKALWCFLLGAPQEDRQSLKKTVSFINDRIGKKDCAFITTGIRIYPGTSLYQVALQEGIIDKSDDLLMPRFYFSPKISPQEAQDILATGIKDLSRCIFLSDTQLSSIGTFRRIGTMLRLPTPFWRYAGYMNKISSKSRVISRNWSSHPAVTE